MLSIVDILVLYLYVLVFSGMDSQKKDRITEIKSKYILGAKNPHSYEQYKRMSITPYPY